MNEELDSYTYLWTSTRHQYVLVNLNGKRPPEDSAIFDTKNQGALIIEDDDIRRAVVRRMISSGVEIHHTIPDGPKDC